MPNEPTVRPLEAKDLPILMEGYKKTSTDRDLEYSAKEYLKFIVGTIWVVNPSTYIWVAEVDGQLAGYTSIHVDHSIYETPSDCIYCDVTYVRAKFRKHGIARALWGEAKKFIDDSVIQKVRLVLSPNFEHYNDEILKLGSFKKLLTIYEWNNSKGVQ